MADNRDATDISRTVQVDLASLGPLPQAGAGPLLLARFEDDRPVAFAELIEGEALLVGRSSTAGMRVRRDDVSGLHASFTKRGDTVLVEDLASTNGTWLAGRRLVAPRPIATGDEIALGSCRLRLLREEPGRLRDQIELHRELERAEDYVRAILPVDFSGSDLRIRSAFRPAAKIGGDAFSHDFLPDGRLAFHLIDVSGHGLGSALHSVAVSNQIRRRALPGTDFSRPAEVLIRLNEIYPMEAHGGIYFTIWYGVYDPATGTLDYASGGHPPALLRDRQGRLVPLRTTNPAIGMLDIPSFRAGRQAIGAGDRLYVFSDGVYEIEGADGRIGNLRDLETRLGATDDPGPELLLAEALEKAGGGPLDDDFSMLRIDFGPAPERS